MATDKTYTSFTPIKNGLLNSDGSITTLSGTQVTAANDDGAKLYSEMPVRANKFLDTDGSIKTLSEISGGSSVTVVQTTGTSTTSVMSQDATTIAINGKVEDAITDGHTTIAPSGNAVYDALALKAPLASPVFTGSPTGVVQTYTATLPYANWAGTSAPYTQAATVTGVLATDTPNISLDLSNISDAQTASNDRACWDYVYRAVTSADTITFYADVKQTICDLPIIIKVVR